MASQSLHTVRIPQDVFSRHNTRRRAAGLTWAEYVDRQAPIYIRRKDLLGQIVREEIEAAIDDLAVDLAEVIQDIKDDPEPLEPLVDADEGVCLICDHEANSTGGVLSHVLVEHEDMVNARHAEVDRRRRERGDGVQIDWAGSANGESDALLANGGDGPVMFGEVPEPSPGQSLDAADPRECNGCNRKMSVQYAKVFARDVDGDLWCPECKSRSTRYSNDPIETGGTEPGSVTGESNPRTNLSLEAGDD